MERLELWRKIKHLLEKLTIIETEKQLRMHPDTKQDIENAAAGGPTGPSKIADREEERGRNVASPVTV